MLLLLSLLCSVANASHHVFLIDTALTAPSEEHVKGYLMALEQAFDKYLLSQDKITVYTFQNKVVRQHIFHESVSKRDHILHVLKHDIKDSFKVGCADWTNVLSTVYLKHMNAQNIYLITDENPCSTTDPTVYARKLQLEGINTVAIGVGPNFRKSRKWLNAITSKDHEPVYLESLSFLQRKRYINKNKNKNNHGKRHPTSSDPAAPLTGGEIAAIVIVSVILFILLVASLIYACRYNNEERRMNMNTRNTNARIKSNRRIIRK